MMSEGALTIQKSPQLRYAFQKKQIPWDFISKIISNIEKSYQIG